MNNIGLENKGAQVVAQSLNELLANLQLQYQNARACHWNVKGPHFFDLHVKFEELYNELQLDIDEVAERVLTLGVTPFHTFETYLKHGSIEVISGVSDGKSCVNGLRSGYQLLMQQLRNALPNTEEINDEGSNALMSDLISKYEKHIWMLSAYLQA